MISMLSFAFFNTFYFYRIIILSFLFKQQENLDFKYFKKEPLYLLSFSILNTISESAYHRVYPLKHIFIISATKALIPNI